MLIKEAFAKELPRLVLKNLNYKLFALVFIMAYYIFSDLVIRENIVAFYSRILTSILALGLFVFNLTTPKQHLFTKAYIYNFLLLSAQLMMFAKCLIHIDDGLASNVSGTILILFLVSFELKTTSIKSALFFFLPVTAFYAILWIFYELDKDQILNLSNIFPIVIIGFIVNRTQAGLRFNNFKQNYLLQIEKDKTQEQNLTLTAQKLSLQSQAKELRQLSEAKDKFYSILAHDLRNPYNAIFGYSQLIKNKASEIADQELLNYANTIYSTAYQSYDLLNNLLHWARLQTGHLKYTPEELRLDDIMGNILNLLRGNIEEKQLTINVQSNPFISIIADAFMLETIIRNLLSNAIKYSNEGGKIEVSVKNQNKKMIIIVQDEGVGIPENQINNLFSIGSDFTRKGTNHEQGTGLGLVLCKEFVERHNGNITVESSVNKGSKFIVELPTHQN